VIEARPCNDPAVDGDDAMNREATRHSTPNADVEFALCARIAGGISSIIKI